MATEQVTATTTVEAAPEAVFARAFPPFPEDHLANSLRHLSDLVTSG